jgi:hypothetical protein
LTQKAQGCSSRQESDHRVGQLLRLCFPLLRGELIKVSGRFGWSCHKFLFPSRFIFKKITVRKNLRAGGASRLGFVLKTSPPRPCGLSAVAEAFHKLPVTLAHALHWLALIASGAGLHEAITASAQ